MNGGTATGPNQVVSAGSGMLEASYDESGNLVQLLLKRNSCTDDSGVCSHRFAYDWDEVGRLAEHVAGITNRSPPMNLSTQTCRSRHPQWTKDIHMMPPVSVWSRALPLRPGPATPSTFSRPCASRARNSTLRRETMNEQHPRKSS